MQLIQTLIDRFIGVKLPKNLYFQVNRGIYHISKITEEGIWYKSEGSSSSAILGKEEHSDLMVIGIFMESRKKLIQKPRHVFDCRFI